MPAQWKFTHIIDPKLSITKLYNEEIIDCKNAI